MFGGTCCVRLHFVVREEGCDGGWQWTRRSGGEEEEATESVNAPRDLEKEDEDVFRNQEEFVWNN